MTTLATHPPELEPLLDAILGGVREATGDNFVGAYVCGSLALGAFNPNTSDVDLLIVVERPVSETEFASLDALHKRIPLEGNEFAWPYEVSYLDRQMLRRFEPGSRHVRAGRVVGFGWQPHRQNWVIERWVVREKGIVLAGPDPKTLIDPVAEDDIREAARSEVKIRVADWAHEWNDGVNPAAWIEVQACQAFEVITVCRGLLTVEQGGMPSKLESVNWALEHLPEEWRPLVRWARDHRDDKTLSRDNVLEVIRFVQWAAAESEG